MTLEVPTATVFGTPVMAPATEGAVPFWRVTLRGMSQLGFQANEVTAGIFLLAVISYGAVTDLWQQVPLLLIGALFGTLGAKVARPARVPYEIGLLTFNSCLLALALGNFFAADATLFVTAIVMSAVVGALSALGDKYVPFPVAAVPFIVPFWIIYAIDEKIGLEKLEFPPWDSTVDTQWLIAGIASMGSTLFAGVLIAGIIYFIGMSVSNWKHAVLALAGGLIGSAVAHIGNAAGEAINSGFTGFNAVLAAIAIYVMCGEDLRVALAGSVVTTVIMRVVIETGLQPLAAAFVITTWLMLLLAWAQTRFWDKLPPPKAGADSPEANW